MDDHLTKYQLTSRDLARGRNLKIGAIAAIPVLTIVPATIFLALTLVFGTTPPVAFTILVLGIILTSLGLLAGAALTGYFAYKRSKWTVEMREKIAADGIRAEEIEWFTHELKSNEKRALREITRADLLLADAYRETLASRLTATRITRSSKRELQLTQRRMAKLKTLKSGRAEEFKAQIDSDAKKIATINEEAKLMLSEAEARLQMIEAAATRGRSLADSELALKKLSARSQSLPIALEEAKMTETIQRELEEELADAGEFENE